MKSAEDIESYLLRMGCRTSGRARDLGGQDWTARQLGRLAWPGPVVAFRVKVMDLPADGREELYRTLLALNTTEMVHGAFGLEGDAVVIVHALELENLDFNEFQAVDRRHVHGRRRSTTRSCRSSSTAVRRRQPPRSLARRPGRTNIMGIFSRLGTLIKSNLNDLICKAEDPQKMLNQIVLEMQNQLVEAKKQVAVSIADEKRLKKQWDEQIELSKEWERKAMLAVRAGDDVLAKEALSRKQEHDKHAGRVRQAVAAAEGRRREAEGPAAHAERQDRRGEAQEEHPGRAAEARRGAEGHSGHDARPVGHQRLRHASSA